MPTFPSPTIRYMYPINLAEQDFFTNLGYTYPDLFQVLPCHFNAQTSIQVILYMYSYVLKIRNPLGFSSDTISKSKTAFFIQV
jgi:hypothetical protein